MKHFQSRNGKVREVIDVLEGIELLTFPVVILLEGLLLQAIFNLWEILYHFSESFTVHGSDRAVVLGSD